MRRRQAGTLMCAAASNTGSPSIRIWPPSGFIRPAIILVRLVLPAPEAPNRAVMPLSALKSAHRANSPNVFSMSTAIMSGPVDARRRASRQPFRRHERRNRDEDRHNDQMQGGGVAARRLGERVDRRRNGLRLARNIGDESNGGAEFA